MSDDDEFVEDVPSPKKETPELSNEKNWTEDEVTLLTDLYIEGRKEYDASYTSASKNGPSTKVKMCRAWALRVSQIGVCCRTASSVMDKIRDMKKQAQRAATRQKQSMQRTGGGPPKKPPALHVATLAAVISKGPAIAGIKGGTESFTMKHEPNEDIEVEEELRPHTAPPFPYDREEERLEENRTPKRKPERLNQIEKSSKRARYGMDMDALKLELLQNEVDLSRYRLWAAEQSHAMEVEYHQHRMQMLEENR